MLIGSVKAHRAKWCRPAKACSEGTNYGSKWIHYEAAISRNRKADSEAPTPAEDKTKQRDTRRMIDIIRGKF